MPYTVNLKQNVSKENILSHALRNLLWMCIKKLKRNIEHYILFERININCGGTHSDSNQMDSGGEADTVTKLQNSDCSFRQTVCILSDILA